MASSILQLPFQMLSILGIWKPNYKSSNFVARQLLYRLYSYFICFILCLYLTLSSGALVTAKSTMEFSEIFYTLATVLLTCVKSLNILFRRKDIQRLKQIVERNHFFLSENEAETIIVSRMNHLIR